MCEIEREREMWLVMRGVIGISASDCLLLTVAPVSAALFLAAQW